MKPIFLLLFIFAFYSSSLAGETITYTVDGKNYEGYYAATNKAGPLVVIIHDWDGLTEYEIMRTKMLVDLGYNVFAADLFGAGVRPVEINNKKALTGELYKNPKKMRALIAAAFKAAENLGLDTNNAVLAGYCFGGAAALEYARSGADVKGFVAFHGGLATPEGQNYEAAEGKYLILHGTADSVVSMSDFARLAEQLESEELTHEMITYSGAPHAFTVFGTDNYREDADKKSWDYFTRWLKATL
jgi:dienelactone hydrolase